MVTLRPSRAGDLAWITALERRPDHLDAIGQWSDAEHLAAIEGRDGREHWIIEREGERAGYLIACDRREAGTGIYVKRILVEAKERGTGRAALAAFLEQAFARPGADGVWLIVRNGNERARHVYASLGFEPFEPPEDVARRFDAVNEAPADKCRRMRLARERWEGGVDYNCAGKSPAPMSSDPPLYADLDGTVLSTDLLYESFLSAFRRSPWVAVQCLGWLLQGRARLKEELARRATIDVARLPYREPVLQFLREERARGRRIVLTTASWNTLAEAVAKHLGLFDAVMATSAAANLKGEVKAARIVADCGEGCFDYMGDSAADLAVWRRSRHAYVVGDSGRLADRIPPNVPVKRVFPANAAGSLAAAVRALRPHQWAKNLLLFVPLVAAHRVAEIHAVADATLAFLAFCLVASGAYLVNDLLDLRADRAHPRKRLRPLAAGEISIPVALALAGACFAGALFASAPLPAGFQLTLAAYFGLTSVYSLWLKPLAVLDLVALAMLYTVRIIAGGFAIGAPVSFWLLAFAMFIFFSLALVKRYAELVALGGERTEAAPGRGYRAGDAPVILAVGTASAMVSALVLALYINGETAKNLYGRPELLWILCPLLLYWISRVWLLAARGRMHDDPVLFAVRDGASYAVAAVGGLVVWLAT